LSYSTVFVKICIFIKKNVEMKKSILSIFLVLFAFSFVNAQETVYVLKDKKTKKNRINTDRTVEHMNVLKYDPLQTITGEVKFSFERVLSQKTSLEVSLGPTLDGLSSFRAFNGFSFVSEGRLGMVAELGYRFYPLDDTPALNRLYVSPVVGWKIYNSRFNPDDNFYPGLESEDFNRQRGFFTFNIGMQSWLAKSFSIDYYAGFGLAMLRENNFFISEIYNPETEIFETSLVKNSFNSNVFQFKLGVKVGIGWTE